MKTIEFAYPRDKVYRAFTELVLQGHTEEVFEIWESGTKTSYTVLEKIENKCLDVKMKNHQMESRLTIHLSGNTMAKMEYQLETKGAWNRLFTTVFLNEGKLLNRYIYMVQQHLKERR